MEARTIALSNTWAQLFQSTTETGMGFHTGNVELTDGRRFNDVIFTSGYITKVRGYAVVPFASEAIIRIQLTGHKWNWNE